MSLKILEVGITQIIDLCKILQNSCEEINNPCLKIFIYTQPYKNQLITRNQDLLIQFFIMVQRFYYYLNQNKLLHRALDMLDNENQNNKIKENLYVYYSNKLKQSYMNSEKLINYKLLDCNIKNLDKVEYICI